MADPKKPRRPETRPDVERPREDAAPEHLDTAAPDRAETEEDETVGFEEPPERGREP